MSSPLAATSGAAVWPQRPGDDSTSRSASTVSAVTDSKTVVEDLAAWLTRIWDEEERLAKAAFSNQADPEEGWGEEGRAVTPHVGVIHEDVQRAHVVRWHPGTVLARIAVDRKILELHSYHMTASLDSHFKRITGTEHPRCDTCASQDENGEQWPCETLRLLASLYKGREGWQEAWRV
jgi:hypothetical protein